MTRACLQAGHTLDSQTHRRRSLSSKSQPSRRSLVDGELLAQGEVLEGELAVAAEEEREEPEQVEQEGDHRAGFSPDQSRQINHLAAGRSFGEGQDRAGDHRSIDHLPRIGRRAATVLRHRYAARGRSPSRAERLSWLTQAFDNGVLVSIRTFTTRPCRRDADDRLLRQAGRL